MATHGVIKYNLAVFWDHEYRDLDYTSEPFNDSESTSTWIAPGYPNRFVGDMCDMRSPQPSWNQKFIDHFASLGWNNIGTSYYRMKTGTVLPVHSDLYLKYIDLFDLAGREHSICRAIIMLEDWQSGHYAEIAGQVMAPWTAGTVFEWRHDTPHMAANIGLADRYTLQITGHL